MTAVVESPNDRNARVDARRRDRAWRGGIVLLFGVWVLLRVVLVALGGEFGRTERVDVGGRSVATIVFRDESSPASTLVVATHGAFASKESLVPLCWEARQRGADCVVVDALSHGASDAAPKRDPVPAMRSALHVERALGPYRSVRFVGHSMGGYLGAGTEFPCSASVAIGQPVPCSSARSVFGDVHRSLGLPPEAYPLSHVVEPWTPAVLGRTAQLLLGGAPSDGASSVRIMVAFASFFTMTALGVVVARRLRASARLAPVTASMLAACVLWAALVVGACHTIWYLVPTQLSDAVVLALVVAPSLGVAQCARRVGIRSSAAGVVIAALVSESVAALMFATNHMPLFGRLLILLPLLNLALIGVVALAERLTRDRRDQTPSSAAFSAVMHGAFLALLFPAFQ